VTYLLPWLGVGLTLFLYKLVPTSFEILFLINIWLFSLPHTFSTFTRSDRRTKKSILLTLSLFIFFLFSILTFSNLSSLVVLYSFYFYWQQFHYGKQNLGLAHWSANESSTWIDKAFYLSTVGLCLTGLFTDGPQNFFGYLLSNPHPFVLSKGIIVGSLGMITLLYACYRPRHLNHALGHVMIFSLAYLYCEHFALGWLLLNVFHNLQYLNFMKGFEKRLNFVVVPVLLTSILYVLQFHVINGLILFSLPLSLGLMLALNFTHYTLDGMIWKKK
jgi:hypothetical protein